MNIHPQLQRDCVVVGRFPLCYLLLMQDANYPWFILVPDRPNVAELYELTAEDQQRFWRESMHLAETLAQTFGADKMNIAALGNVVPQLHVHHIVRYVGDAAWPAPVWGKHPPRPYAAEELAAVVARLHGRLGEGFRFHCSRVD